MMEIVETRVEREIHRERDRKARIDDRHDYLFVIIFCSSVHDCVVSFTAAITITKPEVGLGRSLVEFKFKFRSSRDETMFRDNETAVFNAPSRPY